MSNIVYQIYFRFAKQFGKRNLDADTTINFLHTQLDNLIKPGIQSDYIPIYLYDYKKDGVYWRQNMIDDYPVFYSELWAKYSNKKQDESYKGGRLKPEAYNQILGYTRKASELLKKGNLWFGTPGLESDDYAGLLVKYKPENVYIDLLTVDRDWCGLTRPKVRWINMLPKKRYTIETEIEAVLYFQEKLSASIKSPIEAYEAKRVKGELGDNLPPGCHIEMIDLYNHAAPIDYGFKPAHDAIKQFYLTGNY